VVFRQSLGHKWKLLGVLKLLFTVPVSIYDNAITVSVVVPLIPSPYSNTLDLYYNNYTFVVRQYAFKTVNDWLSDKYNATNNSRFLAVEAFWDLNPWLEKYFLTES